MDTSATRDGPARGCRRRARSPVHAGMSRATTGSWRLEASPPVVAAWLTEALSRRHGDLVVVAHVRTAGPRQRGRWREASYRESWAAGDTSGKSRRPSGEGALKTAAHSMTPPQAPRWPTPSVQPVPRRVRHHRRLHLSIRAGKRPAAPSGPQAAGPAYRGGWVVDARRGNVMTQPSDDGERRIVVGVDGSAPSQAALAWAVKQAALTGAVVDAVIAWEVPANYSFLVQVPVDINYADIAAQVVTDAIAEVSGPGEQVKIRSTPTEGSPARVLLDASKGAELLVVGFRGHGGFTEALLGSVSQHCVHHATCPVVVIRHPATGP
jgi:nucleotide-binding universal stress UspA family protein